MKGILKGAKKVGGIELFEGVYRKVMEQREEICKAFIAKYGCGPEELEQVQINGKSEIRWFIRRKNWRTKNDQRD